MKTILVILLLILLSDLILAQEANLDPIVRKVQDEKYRDAYAMLHEAMSKEQKDEYFFLLGLVYEGMEDFYHAAENYEKIYEKRGSPYREVAFVRLIICSDLIKEYDRTKDLIEEFLSIFPESKYKSEILKRLKELNK